jgi:uracil-DNA glycosylase family protein
VTSRLDALRAEAAHCTNCDLYENATQTVFGEGPEDAEVMLVGETPGDKEDLEGRPFVGPSGRLLDEALAEAGIDRSRTYVTNAVKHFKWTPRGKARLHKTPNVAEQRACRPWLDAELEVVQPTVLVALGAIAAKALFGASFKVTVERGRIIETPLARYGLATVHPSSILRMRSPERDAARAAFVDDLRMAASALG